jgi:hypothetical protein
MCQTKQQELRWHLAVMIPRLPLTAKERKVTTSCLITYLADRSSIVRTCALQGLADLARDDPGSRAAVIKIVCEALRKGTPAMKARSRKLLSQLQRQ